MSKEKVNAIKEIEMERKDLKESLNEVKEINQEQTEAIKEIKDINETQSSLIQEVKTINAEQFKALDSIHKLNNEQKDSLLDLKDTLNGVGENLYTIERTTTRINKAGALKLLAGAAGIGTVGGLQLANLLKSPKTPEIQNVIQVDGLDSLVNNMAGSNIIAKGIQSDIQDVQRKMTRNYVDGLNITLEQFEELKKLLKEKQTDEVDSEKLNKVLDSVESNIFVTQSDIEQIKEENKQINKKLTDLLSAFYEIEKNSERRFNTLEDDNWVLKQSLEDTEANIYDALKWAVKKINEHTTKEINETVESWREAMTTAQFEITEYLEKIKNDILIDVWA